MGADLVLNIRQEGSTDPFSIVQNIVGTTHISTSRNPIMVSINVYLSIVHTKMSRTFMC